MSSDEFSHKPTLLITAATDGKFAHAALLETLKVIEAKNTEELQLLILFIKTKIGEDGTIKDEKTKSEIEMRMNDFIRIMDQL